jgi:hypothetical protein
MPDFQLKITSGSELIVWNDPATADTPSRINPVVRHPHKYHRAWRFVAMTIKATVAGAEGPPDGDLDGRLFAWSWVSTREPGYSPPIPTVTGYTSIVAFPVDHFLTGHYELLCSRPDGGAVGISFQIEDT